MNRKAALLFSVALSACLPAPDPKSEWVAAPLNQANEPADSRAKINEKDIVRIITKDGKKDLLDVHQVESTSFYGVSLKDHRTYHVHYSALKEMEVRRWGVGLTFLTIEPK